MGAKGWIEACCRLHLAQGCSLETPTQDHSAKAFLDAKLHQLRMAMLDYIPQNGTQPQRPDYFHPPIPQDWFSQTCSSLDGYLSCNGRPTSEPELSSPSLPCTTLLFSSRCSWRLQKRKSVLQHHFLVVNTSTFAPARSLVSNGILFGMRNKSGVKLASLELELTGWKWSWKL